MEKVTLTEEWRDVAGFEGLYQVSNFGRVRSLKFGKEKLLKPVKNKDGYLQVTLYRAGEREQPLVHRLVANAFISNPLNLSDVNHKDENKKNNFVYIDDFGKVDETKSNLEWMTRKQNINFGTRNQRVAEAMTNGKLSKAVLQFTKDLVFIREWSSTHEVERQLGFSNGNISSCCNGRYKTAYGFIWRYK